MKQLLRYAWPALLLVAAVLSPTVGTTVTLSVLGVITVLLAVGREKKLARLVRDLGDLLSIEYKTPSVAMQRSLRRLQINMLGLAVVSEIIIFIVLLLGNLDITVARNYALLVLVALAPLGLELELRALLLSRGPETIRTAIGYATEDAYALLAVIGLSFIGTLWLHIPGALSVMQILFITCVARPLLSGRALQTVPHKTDWVWRVAFAASITYGSFVLFFIRHYLEPRYADMINPITWQATTMAWLSFMGCQTILVLINPRAPWAAVRRSGLLLALAVVVSYVTPAGRFFMVHGVAASDWAWVIIASLVFAALVLLRRGMTLHSRKAVVALQRQTKA